MTVFSDSGNLFKMLWLWLLPLMLMSLQVRAQITPSDNIISVDITMPQNISYNYDSCFISCLNIGMRETGLHFLWKSSIETSPGVFNLSDFDIANEYYPGYQVSVNLAIDPIETNVNELPSDINTLPFNDTTVIKRFKTLLDSVFKHIPNLTLSSLVIGSETDAYLGTDSTRWAQYTNFFSIVSAYAKTLRPGLQVACETTYGGMTGAASKYIQAINVYSDYIGVSYYPLNPDYTAEPTEIVKTDFSNVVLQYPSKPVYYYQLGYPSGKSCNSSELQQSQFIQQVFQTWDIYAGHIKMINFEWLHDISYTSVEYYSNYYGVSDTVFLAYLGSLGLQTWNGNGTNKPAFIELECEAKQRGYNALPVNCSNSGTEILNNFPDNPIMILYPNPVQNNLTVETSFDLINAEIRIYNLLGLEEKDIRDVQGKTINIEISDLPNGIYYLNLYYDNQCIVKYFIKSL